MVWPRQVSLTFEKPVETAIHLDIVNVKVGGSSVLEGDGLDGARGAAGRAGREHPEGLAGGPGGERARGAVERDCGAQADADQRNGLLQSAGTSLSS